MKETERMHREEQFFQDLMNGKKSLNDLRVELGLEKQKDDNRFLRIGEKDVRVVHLLMENREEFGTDFIHEQVYPAITKGLNDLYCFNRLCANSVEEYTEMTQEDCEMIKTYINNYIDAMYKAMVHLGSCENRFDK
ncbi:hypothetical protein P4V88_27485 [Bacillus thuringiensis]|uniref:hypothetical protein n=2 Tax=Bacillus thuringiensis TaxID=1428 RepID=UPI000A366D70|nr:hypothetical protein [Bacillus thuringiensis]MED2128931.1 hypothetical protein [Bacillus thuringiensis]MED2148655.1 hypothetical protein [Bacillus thuringiensis]MED2175637.1 hypothetical protein [Bacillus thuringiensis]MED2478080.1 hypothetical protein [Bacillus thuringiensis]MED2575274.1 hypothetical protein [Bacillus thuringiensis]